MVEIRISSSILMIFVLVERPLSRLVSRKAQLALLNG